MKTTMSVCTGALEARCIDTPVRRKVRSPNMFNHCNPCSPSAEGKPHRRVKSWTGPLLRDLREGRERPQLLSPWKVCAARRVPRRRTPWYRESENPRLPVANFAQCEEHDYHGYRVASSPPSAPEFRPYWIKQYHPDRPKFTASTPPSIKHHPVGGLT